MGIMENKVGLLVYTKGRLKNLQGPKDKYMENLNKQAHEIGFEKVVIS